MIAVFLINMLRGFTIKRALYAVAAVAISFVVWQGVQFVDDKIEADKKIVQLEDLIETKDETIRVMEEAAEQKSHALETADAVRTNQERLRFSYDAIRRDAASVKEEDDGEVAPVLRRTLDALDRM